MATAPNETATRKPLTAKQQRFVDEYLIDSNATQAAIRAGYSEHTANEQGSRLLANVKVREAVDVGQAKVAEKLGLTLDSHLEELASLRDGAKAADQYGAAITAETSRGKAAGLYVERSEHKISGKLAVSVVMTREGRRRTAS